MADDTTRAPWEGPPPPKLTKEIAFPNWAGQCLDCGKPHSWKAVVAWICPPCRKIRAEAFDPEAADRTEREPEAEEPMAPWDIHRKKAPEHQDDLFVTTKRKKGTTRRRES